MQESNYNDRCSLASLFEEDHSALNKRASSTPNLLDAASLCNLFENDHQTEQFLTVNMKTKKSLSRGKVSRSSASQQGDKIQDLFSCDVSKLLARQNAAKGETFLNSNKKDSVSTLHKFGNYSAPSLLNSLPFLSPSLTICQNETLKQRHDKLIIDTIDRKRRREGYLVNEEKNYNHIFNGNTSLIGKASTGIKKADLPGKFDIVCGKSKNCANHYGNRRFEVVLGMYAPKYEVAKSKQERMDLTKEIVGCIHSSGGRFLRYNQKEKEWQEITTVMARDKVSHALRTRMASSSIFTERR